MTHQEILTGYKIQVEEIALYIKANKVDINKVDFMDIVRGWYRQNVKFDSYYKDNQKEVLEVLKKLTRKAR